MNLLLVDDEYLALEALKKMVSRVLSEEVINAYTKASEAMEYAKSNKVDIAFLDINMRMINGLQMAEMLQEINPKTNIIFVTGYSEYALDAFKISASAYLTKPVTEEAIRKAMTQLRYPIETKRVTFHCFGNFEVYCDGKPVRFSLKKTKELLAYLVDRQGAECRRNEIISVLFEDTTNTEYYKKLRKNLLDTFAELGVAEVINSTRGGLAVNRDLVKCDYYDYLKGDQKEPPMEYMTQYSFGEETFAKLSKNK